MKLQSVIIFILVIPFLLPACTTRHENVKQNIPEHIRSEAIKVELDLDKIVEVKIKNSNEIIKVKRFESNDVLLGIDSDGQDVKFAIKDIEEAWTLNEVYLKGDRSDWYYNCSDNHLKCFLGKLGVVLVVIAVVSLF